jgi:hypothetical protein
VALFDTARSIYLAICDDPQAISAVRTERASLALAIATDPNGAVHVTSATMNGQTFMATNSLKPTERLRVLALVCSMADAGAVPSKTVELYFP